MASEKPNAVLSRSISPSTTCPLSTCTLRNHDTCSHYGNSPNSICTGLCLVPTLTQSETSPGLPHLCTLQVLALMLGGVQRGMLFLEAVWNNHTKELSPDNPSQLKHPPKDPAVPSFFLLLLLTKPPCVTFSKICVVPCPQPASHILVVSLCLCSAAKFMCVCVRVCLFVFCGALTMSYLNTKRSSY